MSIANLTQDEADAGEWKWPDPATGVSVTQHAFDGRRYFIARYASSKIPTQAELDAAVAEHDAEVIWPGKIKAAQAVENARGAHVVRTAEDTKSIKVDASDDAHHERVFEDAGHYTSHGETDNVKKNPKTFPMRVNRGNVAQEEKLTISFTPGTAADLSVVLNGLTVTYQATAENTLAEARKGLRLAINSFHANNLAQLLAANGATDAELLVVSTIEGKPFTLVAGKGTAVENVKENAVGQLYDIGSPDELEHLKILGSIVRSLHKHTGLWLRTLAPDDRPALDAPNLWADQAEIAHHARKAGFSAVMRSPSGADDAFYCVQAAEGYTGVDCAVILHRDEKIAVKARKDSEKAAGARLARLIAASEVD